MKRALFLVKSPPYGTLRVTEGYRAALGTAATGTPTHVVLLGDGVYAALKGQDARGIDQHNVEELMESLVDLGVGVHLHSPSVLERGLDADDLMPLPPVDIDRLRDLIHDASAVFVF